MANGFEFIDNSEIAKKAIEAAMIRAMESACLLVEGQAKALAPVGDTGELRDKVDHKVENKNGTVTGTVGSPLDYAIYIEYGTGEFAENGAGRKGGWCYTNEEGIEHWTRGNKPQPFLRPAFRRNRKNIENILGGKIRTSFKG